MKNIHKLYCFIVLLVLLTGAVSCKKEFLEITPKGNLIAQTTSDYNLLLNNLDLLNIALFDGDGLAQSALGDEVAAAEPDFSGSQLRTQRLFRWEDVIYDPNQNALEMVVPMRNIYSYNKIINEVMVSKDGTEQQKKSIHAEALASRAWTYFLLINYYGKPYSSSSSTDPGFPIVTKSDVTETNFNRASVQEVYEFIINDLQTAIPNLPTQTTHRLRMSKAAAEGILGKVYTFMGKFDLALPQLNLAITDMGSGTFPVQLYDYNVTFGTGGAFLPADPDDGVYMYPVVVNNQEVAFGKQFFNFWCGGNNELVITPQTAALYGASDLRLNFYSNRPYYGSAPYPAGLLRRNSPIATQFGVIVPDLYLLRAECKARLNDLAGAKADVEALRVKRMPAVNAPVPAPIAGNQTALVKFILEERIQEFAVQGYRWFDMRRLSVDPNYSTTVNTIHKLYSATGAVTTFTLRPERLVLRFPQKIIDQNPGMQNNQ